MKKIALLFAGQGAQYVGMGKEFYDQYDEVKALYKNASDVLGYDLEKICFTENDLINQTKYTQPSMLVTSLGIYTALKKEVDIAPSYIAGFSLGEYSGLYAAGVFDFTSIVHLIKKRAEFMDECATHTPGKMAAIIGMKQEDLENLCSEVSNNIGLVRIANYNSPSQMVIGGTKEAVETVCNEAKHHGARRTVLLNVSGGFHTPLMREAADKMVHEIQESNYQSPNTKVIMNATGDVLDIDELPELMKKQIESSVYFQDSIKRMIDNGVDTFIEIGPGKVLSGFVRKIDRSKKVISVNNIEDLNEVKAWI